MTLSGARCAGQQAQHHMIPTTPKNTEEARSLQAAVRLWYFTVEDFDGNTEYLGPDGESIDDCEADFIRAMENAQATERQIHNLIYQPV